jgi:hypothetical protein
MSDLYTEEMVLDLREPILANFHPPTDKHGSWHIRPDEMARAILDAVAPSIVRRAKAEALREFADATSDLYPLDVWPDPNKFHDSVDRRSARMARLVAAQARARAEEIEAGE